MKFASATPVEPLLFEKPRFGFLIVFATQTQKQMCPTLDCWLISNRQVHPSPRRVGSARQSEQPSVRREALPRIQGLHIHPYVAQSGSTAVGRFVTSLREQCSCEERVCGCSVEGNLRKAAHAREEHQCNLVWFVLFQHDVYNYAL